MQGFPFDPNPLIIMLASMFIGAFMTWRYRDMKELQRAESLKQTFRRFRDFADKNDDDASASAYHYAEHLAHRVLIDGVRYAADEKIVMLKADAAPNN